MPEKIRKFIAAVILVTPLLLAMGFYQGTLQKQNDGMIVRLLDKTASKDARLMKIQVCADNIIRVVASPGEAFSTRTSLMAAQTKWKPVPYSVQILGSTLKIATSKISAELSLKSGEIAFHDKSGHLILQERPGGGKTIAEANVMGEKTYQIRQVFLSPQDEAFYGLGQHQNAVMNWKGYNVDMFQYNLVDIVPFVVSNRNYGILWDNNSRMKFGDPREYQPLSVLKTLSADDKEGGLTAEYFRDEKFQRLLIKRQESIIDHENSDEMGGYPAGFNPTAGSVRWSGEIGSNQPGIHDFRFFSSTMQGSGSMAILSWIHGGRTGAPGLTCSSCRWNQANGIR